MGIVYEAITDLIGTPTNFVGEMIFLVGEFMLVVVIFLILGGALVKLLTRR